MYLDRAVQMSNGHILSRGDRDMKKPQAKVTCIGRAEPTKKALDEFIEQYLIMAEKYEKKIQKTTGS
ncbi:hypothetical protein QA612_09860 [Evansella sp. AB-P1]|uniref:hypothetical protein n=1 Tax=Evansella sp. AB-P1 TaxID=3037653 RepID=UPI00241EEC2F|nr:hypothetical protein [Evansella sp. AB-P1]MDG5787804.1 hypothetical protein [Evansella sp. AB-P1]